MGKSFRSNDEYSRKYANKRRNIGGTKKKQNKVRQYDDLNLNKVMDEYRRIDVE